MAEGKEMMSTVKQCAIDDSNKMSRLEDVVTKAMSIDNPLIMSLKLDIERVCALAANNQAPDTAKLCLIMIEMLLDLGSKLDLPPDMAAKHKNQLAILKAKIEGINGLLNPQLRRGKVRKNP